MDSAVGMAASLTADLVSSDRAYFAAGARSQPIRGGAVRWMEGLQHLAVGCVVEPIDQDVQLDELTHEASSTLDRIGSPFFRLYAARSTHQGQSELGCAIELAMVRSTAPTSSYPAPLPGLRLRPVQSSSEWLAKQELAEALERLPDGKAASARQWIELEQRKAAAGYCLFYVAELDNQICATFGLAKCGPLMRLKNLAVHPDLRRRGVGAAIIAAALAHARQSGCQWLGAFAISGSAGEYLYANSGLKVIGTQTEWFGPRLNIPVVVEPCRRPALPC